MLNNTKDFSAPILTGQIATGVVVSNSDPLHLGRVKVRIAELHPQNLEDQYLPWVESWQFRSSVNGQGNINVPDVGSKCRVMFPSDDMYSGIYICGIPNVNQELLEDYPNSYGYIDRSGNLFLVNTERDTFTFYHVSGTNIDIDASGHTKIQITDQSPENGNGTTRNPDSLTIEVIGNLDLKVSKDINIECSNLKINARNTISYMSSILSCNQDSLIELNANSMINGTAGAGINFMTNGVISAIGTSGNFGGTGSTFDGHSIMSFMTDVSHTPFMAFNPEGVPPTPSVTPVNNPSIVSPETPAIRKREAYGE